MARIHPTAVIDPTAHVGQTTQIGPYCIIGANVTLGEGCRLHSHVVIAGPTTIGDGNEFYPFCSIGQRSQDLKYEGEPTHLEIGAGNTFREFSTVHHDMTGEGPVVGKNHMVADRAVMGNVGVGEEVAVASDTGNPAG